MKLLKIVVLFSEKNKSKLNEFLLRISKIICQRGKQNNVISNRKQDYFAYPIRRLFSLFQAKTHFIFTFFSENKILFTCLRNLDLRFFWYFGCMETRQKNLSKKSYFCSVSIKTILLNAIMSDALSLFADDILNEPIRCRSVMTGQQWTSPQSHLTHLHW